MSKLMAILILLCGLTNMAWSREPIPDKLVVLTFDDSVKSHFTVVRPILLKHKFRATFFITEGFEFKTNKQHYMTWDEIAHLHADGFEIGNHTGDHMSLTPNDPEKLAEQLAQLDEQLQAINDRCREFGIPPTTSFAYPGNGIHRDALPILRKAGIKFARRGGAPEHDYESGRGFAYEPGLDHPLLIPSAGDARPKWTLDDFKQAVSQAKHGRIAVLQFHGVPDLAHPWVHSPVERFQEYMQYLADEKFTVIALGDLEKYVDPAIEPRDHEGVINDRILALKQQESRDNFRSPAGDKELRRWLENMVWYHRFHSSEVSTATGLSADEIEAALRRFDIRPETKPERPDNAPLLVLPYPGGRHPRIGFLDGAIRPQRDTKLSVFLPWNEKGYVVLDVPEAIRRNNEAEHGLLYLAHTHVDTMWTKQGISLKPVEWDVRQDGSLWMQRRLPNGVLFGTHVRPERDAVRMRMFLTNGSQEPLSNLRVQNCVMLKAAPEFHASDEEHTFIQGPYACRRSTAGNRWLITTWAPHQRAWANPPCPCLHSDPQFADCAPGETKRLYGWLSFYEGTDIEAELKRIDALDWQNGEK